MLRRTSEKVIGVLHDELIEWRRGSHQHGARAPAAASGAPRTLPGGRNRARIACHDCGVERSNINAEFERVCRNHAANSAFAQTVLDFSPFAREISPAIT